LPCFLLFVFRFHYYDERSIQFRTFIAKNARADCHGLNLSQFQSETAAERPTPDRAAERTKRLVPPDQESGAPVAVPHSCAFQQDPDQGGSKKAEFTGRGRLVPCGMDKMENLRGRAVPAPFLEPALDPDGVSKIVRDTFARAK